jgi:predicted HTH transcriptional regulator
MNKTELLIRLADIKWDDFEVKEARAELPKNIWETVSAFSNVAGGWIVLGVVQKGKKFEIQGVENPEKLEQDFTTVLRSRNKFNVFRCVKLAENAGYGFDKILKWEKSTNTKVIFENSIDFSLVTFKLPENLPELPEKLPENLSGLPENPIELPENTVELPENPIELPEKLPENTVELPENQFRMIMIMKKNSYVTITELSKQLKISETAIKSNIRKLKSKGFVERVGPDKGGYWKIKLIDES